MSSADESQYPLHLMKYCYLSALSSTMHCCQIFSQSIMPCFNTCQCLLRFMSRRSFIEQKRTFEKIFISDLHQEYGNICPGGLVSAWESSARLAISSYSALLVSCQHNTFVSSLETLIIPDGTFKDGFFTNCVCCRESCLLKRAMHRATYPRRTHTTLALLLCFAQTSSIECS